MKYIVPSDFNRSSMTLPTCVFFLKNMFAPQSTVPFPPTFNVFVLISLGKENYREASLGLKYFFLI